MGAAKSSSLRASAAWVTPALFAVAALFFLLLGRKLTVVSGSSMEPSFSDGDVVSVCAPENLSRFDVVTFTIPGSTMGAVKRVVGLPGELVTITPPDSICVDGEELAEYWEYPSGFFAEPAEVALGEGEYFVLGDNLEHSTDSRSFGAVEEESLRRKVLGKRVGGQQAE